jgi:hypothetical protein
VKTRLSFLWRQPKAKSSTFASGCVRMFKKGTFSGELMTPTLLEFHHIIFIFGMFTGT